MRESFIEAAWHGHSDCEACGIRHLVLFANLRRGDFGLLHHRIDDIHLPQSARLYREGEAGQSLFTLRPGIIKLVCDNANGERRIVRLLRKGDVAGLEALVDDRYRHSAEVVEPTDVCRIPTDVVRDLNLTTPHVCRELMARWEKSVREADTWLAELSRGGLRGRVARLLLYLHANCDRVSITLLSREDMAAILGVARENVSRVVSEFKRTGALKAVRGGRFELNISLLENAITD